MDHVTTIARRKLGKGDDWHIGRWEMIGNTRDVLIHGGITMLIERGKRKGQKKWPKQLDVCVVTEAEEIAERARYEAETGNCAECGGGRQVWAGWNVNTGDKYRPCRRCCASGRAPKQEIAE